MKCFNRQKAVSNQNFAIKTDPINLIFISYVIIKHVNNNFNIDNRYIFTRYKNALQTIAILDFTYFVRVTRKVEHRCHRNHQSNTHKENWHESKKDWIKPDEALMFETNR